ncbi:MAG: MerR family transcriptional regulator [Dehalococcoidia bacterium]
MTTLTSGDLTRVTGIPERRIRNLRDAGALQPEQAGKGTGRFCLFSVTDATAIAFAMRWANLGYKAKLIHAICEALSAYSEDALLAEFRAGRTHLVPNPDGPMKLIRWKADRESGDVFDVEKSYRQVRAMIDQAALEASAVQGRGRRRGLAK